MAAGPVSRILSAIAGVTVIPLRRPLLNACRAPQHVQLPRAGDPLATYPGLPSIAGCPFGLARRAGMPPDRSGIVPYLVLLRVGFAMQRPLLAARCALTAPFHPYRTLAGEAVSSLWHSPSNGLETIVPDVIRHTALWSSDFPPACRGRPATVRSNCQHGDYT